MVPKFLIPKHKYDLIRLGGNYDGGYLLRNSIENSKFSYLQEWLVIFFRKDYLKKTGKTIYCYDHTLNFQYFILHGIYF